MHRIAIRNDCFALYIKSRNTSSARLAPGEKSTANCAVRGVLHKPELDPGRRGDGNSAASLQRLLAQKGLGELPCRLLQPRMRARFGHG